MSSVLRVLDSLNDIQKQVCVSEKNIILTACPGSGKTRVITHRLAYLAETFKDSYKYNIAITYTNRAANEIEKRIENMGIGTDNIWTGTIHQFCMKFIIRPYGMYHSKLCKGYIIIDEYKKEKYFREIAKKLGVKETFINKLYENEEIKKAYYELLCSNKEIDFELILTYALELLSYNNFIAENIALIIRSIHVDEYQDTNQMQYSILAKLIKANKRINILFVGDVNQAIYRSIGGIAKNKNELEEMFQISFEEVVLNSCYRSTQRLVEYYNEFAWLSTNPYASGQNKDKSGIIKYNYEVHKSELCNDIVGIIKEKLEENVPENEICVIAPQWQTLFSMANELRKLLPNCNFDAPDLTPIKYDPMNPFFLIAKLIYTKQSRYPSVRRKEAKLILEILSDEYQLSLNREVTNLDVLQIINASPIFVEDGIQTIRICIERMVGILEIEMVNELKETYDIFFERIENRVSNYDLSIAYNSIEKSFREKKGIVLSTIHGVKGEEYNTVIAFDLQKGKIPNWQYYINENLKPFKREESCKLLYVLCSRAKEELYLFSEQGRCTAKGNEYVPTEELQQYQYAYDN